MKVTYKLQLSLAESFLSRRGRMGQVTLRINFTRVFRNCRNHKFLTSDIYPYFTRKNAIRLVYNKKAKGSLDWPVEMKHVKLGTTSTLFF